MYLFMRGPVLVPVLHVDRRTARRGRAEHARARPASAGRNVRPYAKYDTAPDGSILMTFSDGHPGSYKNNLYYMRFKGGRFYKADGSVIGTTADLPFRLSELDMVQRYSAGEGPRLADGHRLVRRRRAADRVLQPRSATTTSSGTRASTAAGGSRRDVAPAGGGLFGYRNGGITFDHADPRLGRAHPADRRRAGDRGAPHRRRRPLVGRDAAHDATRRSSTSAPSSRAASTSRQRVVVYVSGSASSFRSYRTVVKMRIDDGFFKPAAPAVRNPG